MDQPPSGPQPDRPARFDDARPRLLAGRTRRVQSAMLRRGGPDSRLHLPALRRRAARRTVLEGCGCYRLAGLARAYAVAVRRARPLTLLRGRDILPRQLVGGAVRA